MFLLKKKRYALLSFYLLLSVFVSNTVLAQNSCTINAGGNAIICGSTTTLTAVGGGSFSGVPAWSFTGGTAGVTPVIASPNSLSTDVTGMTATGTYIFQVQQECGDGSMATSQVTITARPRPATFTAGPDITNICATTGTTPLAGVIPAGFTGEWRAENIYSKSRYTATVSDNSTFSNTTIATPVFSLINKADHDLDPAYLAILTIRSLDGVCSYADTTVVRFIPNPVINPIQDNYMCLDPDYTGPDPHYFYLESAPYFDTHFPGSAGTSSTIVELNLVSQPTGGNISLKHIDNNIVVLDGIDVTGVYKFTLTVENDCGEYTTPEITYDFSGERPYAVNFQPAGHGAPDQLMIYYVFASGGEVHCSAKVGNTTPEVFYFSIHPNNLPNLISYVTPSGIIPPGGEPTVVVSGAGTYNRSATVTPPAGGWQIGTYRFDVYTENVDGSCGAVQNYYIHVSDGNRPDVSVPDQAVCYPGTGSVSATIPLPAVYKEVVNASYFQDFSGHYELETISRPAGSSDPEFTTDDLRSITSATTTISNLDKAGDYVFRITARGYNGDVGPFLNQEYACSGSTLTSTFTVRVENLVAANAGSDQDISYSESATIAGNLPGAGTGEWTWIQHPPGATPVVANTNANITTVTEMTDIGIYELEWTITSPHGGCVSSDRVMLISSAVLPVSIVSLDAIRSGNTAILNWHTATETNNKGFEVQRSIDGSNWQAIAFIAGKANGGSSNSELSYTFTDKAPYQGINYYRLKQVDLNGDFEYTATRQLNFGNNGATVKLYPNPAKTTVSITGVEAGSVIRIDDALGKTILTTVRTADVQSAGTINITQLPKGIYMVVITAKDGSAVTRKLIKD